MVIYIHVHELIVVLKSIFPPEENLSYLFTASAIGEAVWLSQHAVPILGATLNATDLIEEAVVVDLGLRKMPRSPDAGLNANPW